MSLLLSVLALSGLTTLIQGAPLPAARVLAKRAVQYIQYTGTGTSPNWPAENSWQSFDQLFAGSVNIIKGSCTQFGAANPSDSEVSDLKSAIKTVAAESNIPAAYIFVIMMQESNGCVRAPTTNYGVRNPGLMQDHNGDASCNDGSQVNPCPASTITQMIRDGVMGTPSGYGLKQLLAQAGGDSVTRYYKAARMYNSGSIAASGNLEDGIATHCYASDIANRLVGWNTAPHNCNLDGADVSVTLPSSSNTPAPQSSEPAAAASPTTSKTSAAPTSTPTATPTTTTPTTTPTSTPTSTPAASTPTAKASGSKDEGSSQSDAPDGLSEGNAGGVFSESGSASNGAKPAALTPKPYTPAENSSSNSSDSSSDPSDTAAAVTAPTSDAPLGPGVSASCPKLYQVVSGDNCYTLGLKYGFTFAEFQSWNTLIDGQCSNLWLGYQYCIGA